MEEKQCCGGWMLYRAFEQAARRAFFSDSTALGQCWWLWLWLWLSMVLDLQDQ